MCTYNIIHKVNTFSQNLNTIPLFYSTSKTSYFLLQTVKNKVIHTKEKRKERNSTIVPLHLDSFNFH